MLPNLCRLVAVFAMLSLTAAASAGSKSSDVKATLLADVTAVKAGTPFSVAIVLTTQPEWHIYWKNPGDAGSATKFSFHLPEGYKADLAEYPLPTKFDQAGDIVAYGYSGTTVFLATITPPKELPNGGKVNVTVDASWLCCKNVCVPGSAKLSLELPVDGGTEKPRPDNRELFKGASAVLPAAVPPPDVVGQVRALNDEAGRAGLEISWKQQPKGDVDVFPLTPEGVELSDIKVNNSHGQNGAVTSKVDMKWRQLAGAQGALKPMPILVAYTDEHGRRHGFFSPIDFQALPNRK